MGKSFIPDFKNPRFRRGGAAALSSVIAVAAVILVNLIAERVPLKADLSARKLYSLSDRTKTVVASLKEDAVLYACFKEGTASTEITEALKLYDEASGRVALKWIDLERDPGFAKRYGTADKEVSIGSVVVVGTSSGRSRTIAYQELYDIGYDRSTGQQTVQGIQLERQITGALAYVASGKTYPVYELTGHGEYTIADYGFDEELRGRNFTLAPLNLLASADVPSDAALLVILSPKTDLSASEADAVRRYLERGGDLAVYFDPGEKLVSLETLLAAYGVERESGLIMEGSESNRYAGNAFLLIPELGKHEITESLVKSRLAITFPASSALRESSLRRSDAVITPLITTTASSWLRADMNEDSPLKAAGEKAGPFVPVYAVEIPSSTEGGNTTRLTVAGGSYFFNPQNPVLAPGNRDFFLNMTAWTVGADDTLGVGSKYFFAMPFQTDGLTAIILLAIVVLLIPGAVLIAGIVVWARRRNR